MLVTLLVDTEFKNISFGHAVTHDFDAWYFDCTWLEKCVVLNAGRFWPERVDLGTRRPPDFWT